MTRAGISNTVLVLYRRYRVCLVNAGTRGKQSRLKTGRECTAFFMLEEVISYQKYRLAKAINNEEQQ